MAYGVTDKGFIKKKLSKIREGIKNKMQDSLGNDIHIDIESELGQVLNIHAEAIYDIWDALEANYYSKYPSTSYGISLDHAMAFTNDKRLDGEKDSELKKRRLITAGRGSRATIPAIESALLTDPHLAIKSVDIIANYDDKPFIDGQPPGSINIVIEGGDNKAIAEKLFNEHIVGGTYLWGNNTELVNYNSKEYPIKFSRVALKNIYLLIELQVQEEFTLPYDSEDEIKAYLKGLVCEKGNSFKRGDDISAIPYISTAFNEIKYIENIQIGLSLEKMPENTMTEFLELTAYEKALFTSENINIVISKNAPITDQIDLQVEASALIESRYYKEPYTRQKLTELIKDVINDQTRGKSVNIALLMKNISFEGLIDFEKFGVRKKGSTDPYKLNYTPLLTQKCKIIIDDIDLKVRPYE